uniref:Uncharacterized protein n=1 Tax=Anguilla anguilla TaxID=7936 RepID=A0A0E9V742_ANGAN
MAALSQEERETTILPSCTACLLHFHMTHFVP